MMMKILINRRLGRGDGDAQVDNEDRQDEN